VLSSIGGLNERWAQIAALQPPAPTRSDQDGGPGLANSGTATGDPLPISPIAGGAASPLSSDTNFLLTVFGGAAGPSSRASASGSTGGSIQDQTIVRSQQPSGTQPSVSATGGNTVADGITGSSLVQELQALVSAGGTVTFARNGVAPPSAQAPGPSGIGDAIRNSDTAVPSWPNGWDSTPGASNGTRYQAGLAAYASSGDRTGQTSAAASVLRGVTA
jgi:hypothetical protein